MNYKFEMKNINKSFPGVKALDNVSIEIVPGEVLVLLGENGAGKSTLLKILAGVYPADSGEIIYNGKKIEIKSTRDAEKHGIYMIYQELNLVPDISVAENIFLGREIHKNIMFLDFKNIYKKTEEILKELSLNINPKSLIKDLSMAQSQMIEIARALMTDAKVIIMDEPTAAITNQETEELFNQINRLKEKGVSIIYISHRLQEVLEIGDKIFVMRDGKYIDTVLAKESTRDQLIKLMVGREINDLFPKKYYPPQKELLRVENISSSKGVKNCSFTLHGSEVVGFAGLMGSGRTELLRAIFGADMNTSGSIYIRGKKSNIKNPKTAVEKGIGFLPEDRKNYGIICGMSVNDNITISSLKKCSKFGFLNTRIEKNTSEKYVENLKIKTPTIYTDIVSLSGGNQQKAILARWLCTEVDIIILDEPTRGIDVSAKREIYLLINKLAEMGKGIIMISSDLPEVIGMSDRILVMSNGTITGELSAENANQLNIMQLATKEVVL